jgi:hypothetical protein
VQNHSTDLPPVEDIMTEADAQHSTLTTRLPLCFACMKQMHFATVEPHIRFSHLDVRHFVCDCGETASDVVVRFR